MKEKGEEQIRKTGIGEEKEEKEKGGEKMQKVREGEENGEEEGWGEGERKEYHCRWILPWLALSRFKWIICIFPSL